MLCHRGSLKQLHHQKCEAELIFSATSSEEVGIRGAKTAVTLVDPDIVFAIDVANHPEIGKRLYQPSTDWKRRDDRLL